MIDFEKQNQFLVDEEIKPVVDNENILDAFRKTPRHLFVDEKYQTEAYSDNTLPIGFHQTTSQPSLMALMVWFLQPNTAKKVLEVGTGCGFQTAILSKLMGQVFSVELIEELAMSAKSRLEKMGCRNVEIKIGDGSLGWAEKAPFDGIIVAAAAAKEIPKNLIDQLKEGGVIVIPVNGKLIAGIKNKGQLEIKEVESVYFVPLVENSKKSS